MSEGLRTVYQRTFAKNREYFEREASSGSAPDVKNRHMLLGSICLGAFHDLTILYAAGETGLFRETLEAKAAWIGEVYRLYGGDLSLDERGVDRLEIALACDVGKVVDPALFPDPEVPFVSIRSALGSGEMDREARAALVFVWALYAHYRGSAEECREALAFLKKAPKGLQQEHRVVSAIAETSLNAGAYNWCDFREVLDRWLRPTGQTNTGADDYRQALRSILALSWCRFRLRRTDRDSFFRVMLCEHSSDEE